MTVTDLREIRDYWAKKYPTVLITLWANQDKDKFYGRMSSHNSSINLEASTIGELIGQGEMFLRKVI